MNNSIINIGNEIKNYRNQTGLSQEDLAKLSGVDRAQISKIESGVALGVTYATVEKLLNSLGKQINISPINQENKKTILHPIVKWAGGKTQLLSKINELLPKEFNWYYEPFIGGGALLFNLQPKSFVINDMNKELIAVYTCFTNDGLFNSLKEKLHELENNHCEEYFYEIRKQDQNELFDAFPIVDRAARMIYLNKSCFNGLYRVNSKGFFNVPSGKKKTIKCFDEDNFNYIREFFKNNKFTILNEDFEKAVATAKKGDLVYFDPPYDTWEEKNGFTSYDKNGFGKQEQIRLANCYKELDKKGVYLMLSNHNTKFINELYKNFNIHVIPAKRMINSNAKGRGEVEEVIITNYE